MGSRQLLGNFLEVKRKEERRKKARELRSGDNCDFCFIEVKS